MEKFKFFWDTMQLCDWRFEGDDHRVLEPVIKFLSQQSDDKIFLFSDQMSELLYGLDTYELAEQCKEVDGFMSDDSFLYSRCVALINGPEYYMRAKSGKCKDMWNMEFESLIYVASQAWEMKHNTEFEHISPLSFETGSNSEGWKR